MARPKKEIEIKRCKICGKILKEETIQCNFERMTGRAGWHMSFYPKMEMCRECSYEMLKFLEGWFQERNKTNIYKKEFFR